MFTRRFCNFIGFIGCFLSIAVAYFYMEKSLYIIPCPLCYAQRIAIGFLGFWFLIAAIFPGKPRSLLSSINGTVLFLIALGGSTLSIRHLVLQSLPKGEASSCGADFKGLFENVGIGDSGFWDAIYIMLTGSGDCGEVLWEMFGLSIPGWTLIAFTGLGLWGLFHNLFRKY